MKLLGLASEDVNSRTKVSKKEEPVTGLPPDIGSLFVLTRDIFLDIISVDVNVPSMEAT